jgi:UDP-N-acetylmuramoyl-tripeptide--D-alanyl-D-alanine ligase
MGVGAGAITSGLNAFTGVKGRMQKKQGLHGSTLIDDTYNANPDSVRAALAVLGRAEGRKIFVLGDMGELGSAAKDLHGRIGAEARAAGVDTLVAMGELSAYAVVAFGAGAHHFEKIEELVAEVEGLLAPGDTMLIKGSRFMQMERVVKRIEL